jgi:hypothetical protein
MKKTSIILLIFFVGFICTPTILSVVSKKFDISEFYNIIEEEQQEENVKNHKELTYIYYNPSLNIDFYNYYSKSKSFYFYNDKLNCNFQFNIIIPPPNFI